MRWILSIALAFFASVGFGQDTPQQFGWIENQEGCAAFCETIPQAVSDSVTSMIETDKGEDALLYRYVVQCVKTSPTLSARWLKDGRLRAYNQGSVGSCTGHGTAAALNCVYAVQCAEAGSPESFEHLLAADALYGLGREAGNMLNYRSDGCCGFMLADAITKMGTLYRKPYSNVDLTEYDEARCRQYGSKGVGAELKTLAKDHVLAEVVNVKSAREAWALIGNGYPINVCSQQGFTTQRDAEGVCEPKGTWAHSMAVIGRRTTENGEKLFLIQNSWGDSSPSGPFWQDQPYGSFFIRESVMDKMLSQGDSFAYSGLGGFEIRSLKTLGTEEFICVSSCLSESSSLSGAQFCFVQK